MGENQRGMGFILPNFKDKSGFCCPVNFFTLHRSIYYISQLKKYFLNRFCLAFRPNNAITLSLLNSAELLEKR